MRTLPLLAGASIWSVFVFFFAFRVHFPGDEALARLQVELQNRSNNRYALEASDLGLWSLAGVRLDDATLYSLKESRRRRRIRRRASGSDDVDNPEDVSDPIKASPLFRAERLRLRLAVLPLLTGTQKVVFDSRTLGGALSGTVAQGDDSQQIYLEGEELDLSLLPIGGESWSVDAVGAMNLDIDLDLSSKSPRESKGEVHIGFEGLGIESANAMGMALTPVRFSEAGFDINLANGKAEFARGVLDGDLLDATFSGYITLGKTDLMKSRLKVNVKMELDSTLDKLAKFSPDLRDARDEDGVYHLLCTGMLSRPSCSADRRASGNLKSTVRKRPDKKDSRPIPKLGPDYEEGPSALDIDSDVRPLNDDEARESRRKRRLERIRERRERLREERKLRADEGGSDGFDDEFFEPQRPKPIPLPGQDFGPEGLLPPEFPPVPDGEFLPQDGFGPEDLPPDERPYDEEGGTLPDDGMNEPY